MYPLMGVRRGWAIVTSRDTHVRWRPMRPLQVRPQVVADGEAPGTATPDTIVGREELRLASAAAPQGDLGGSVRPGATFDLGGCPQQTGVPSCVSAHAPNSPLSMAVKTPSEGGDACP